MGRGVKWQAITCKKVIWLKGWTILSHKDLVAHPAVLTSFCAYRRQLLLMTLGWLREWRPRVSTWWLKWVWKDYTLNTSSAGAGEILFLRTWENGSFSKEIRHLCSHKSSTAKLSTGFTVSSGILWRSPACSSVSPGRSFYMEWGIIFPCPQNDGSWDDFMGRQVKWDKI